MSLSVFLICWVSYCHLLEFSGIKCTLVSSHLLPHSLWTQEQYRICYIFFLTWSLVDYQHMSHLFPMHHLFFFFSYLSNSSPFCTLCEWTPLLMWKHGLFIVPPWKRFRRQNISSALYSPISHVFFVLFFSTEIQKKNKTILQYWGEKTWLDSWPHGQMVNQISSKGLTRFLDIQQIYIWYGMNINTNCKNCKTDLTLCWLT